MPTPATMETAFMDVGGARIRYAEVLDERLPNSRLTIVDAGQFVLEEAPGESASIIADWVTR